MGHGIMAGLIVAVVTLSAVAAATDTPTPIRKFIWPKDAKIEEPQQRFKTRGDVTRITDVKTPYLTVYPASSAKPTPAAIVCPGGGYSHLCVDKEGSETAPWLNGLGITAIVLTYSTPGKRDEAFCDAQRAIKLVRYHAKEWNIDPKRVGIMGFSAGGHLAARMGAESDKKAYDGVDEIDKLDCRPDFCILIYPAYLENKGTLSLPVSKRIPPTVMVQAEDDKRYVPGTKLYYEALQKAEVTSTFLLFKEGGHGFGMRASKDRPLGKWPEQCGAWLKTNGFSGVE